MGAFNFFVGTINGEKRFRWMNEWMIPILIWPSPLMHICFSFISYYFVLCFSNSKTRHIQTNNLLFKMSHTFHFHFILSASKWTVNWDCAGCTTQCAAGKRIIICYSSNELIPDADEHRKKIELESESESLFLKGLSYVIFLAKTPNSETFVAACVMYYGGLHENEVILKLHFW